MTEDKSYEINDLKTEFIKWDNFVRSNYPITEAAILQTSKIIKDGINKTLQITYPNRKIILRLSHKSRPFGFTLDTYKNEIDILLHLHKEGLNVVQPIKKEDGTYITEVDVYYCIVFAYIEGGNPAILTTKEFYDIGKAYAQIHLSMKKIEISIDQTTYMKIDLNRLVLEPLRLIKQQFADFQFKVLEDIALKIQSNLELIDHKMLRQGIIHGDTGIVNIIKGFDNTLWLIDFDFAGYGFWAFDIASFLTCSDFFKYLGYETWKIEHINEQEFFKGYESLIQLNNEERKLIPTLMAAHWIQIVGEMAGTHLRGTKVQKKAAKEFASKIITYLPSIKL